jgi:hypothetical protein
MLEVKKEDLLELSDDVVVHGIPELEKFWAFNLQTGDQYTLSETAHFLLSTFDKPECFKDALRKLAEEYDIPYETAKMDCQEIISRYLEEGLLKIKN